IDPGRILVEQTARGEAGPLAQFAATDVVLDAFPFSGHTATCEALWMGVPVVTLRGDRPCGRLSASVLSSCGLPELIARPAAGYREVARRPAAARGGLARLRGGLRERVRQGLCDAAGFTRRLEGVYRRLWQDWCRDQRGGGPPGLNGFGHAGKAGPPPA